MKTIIKQILYCSSLWWCFDRYWYIDIVIVNELCLCVLHPNPIEYTATTKS